MWAGQWCYAAMPFIAATESVQADSSYPSAIMLLPGLCHRRDCLVEKQSAVKNLVFT